MAARAAAVAARARALLADIDAWAAANPNVRGLRAWRTALNGEIRGLDRIAGGRLADDVQVTGRENNINAVEGEFNAARARPGVEGVGQRFALNGRPGAVEVDVVSDGGRLWTDVKRVRPFGLESNDWVGRPATPGRQARQGLQQQAQEMLQAATQNPLPDGTVPRVEFEFPLGVSPEVAAALRNMGIIVTGVEVPPP